MNTRNRETVKALFSSVDGIGPVNPGEPSEKGKNDLRHGPDYKNKQNPNRNKDFNKLLEDEMEKNRNASQHFMKSGRAIKSSNSYEEAFTVYPWDADRVTPYSDEDLGLSYVVEVYGDEYVNVDDEELEAMKDELVRYFDDEAFVRDWNINNPNDEDQIESFYDIHSDPEELSVDELARYFDYDAFGRDLRLEYNMVWDKKRECWFAARDIDEFENEDDILFLSNR